MKKIFGVLVLLAGILAVSYFQKRFDDSDLKKAVQAVHAKVPDAGQCGAHVESRFRGLVEVRCERGSWTVDVVRGMIIDNHGSSPP